MSINFHRYNSKLCMENGIALSYAVLVIFVVLVVVSVCAVVEFVVVVVIVLRHFKFLLVVNSYTSSMSFYYIKYTKTFLGLWYYFLLQFFKSWIIIRM